MSKLLNTLKAEFGLIAEDIDQSAIEKETLGRLDKSAKLDEIDTVAFGLETDDGKIVKVYVNAEQADDFEKALSAKLGEIDDIEEVFNELSKEFEIVDVEWPDDEDDSTDEDEDADADEPVMDQEVYKNTKEKSDKAKDLSMEGLNYGERVAFQLTEGSNTIENRMVTSSELMIYHALLELGLPEIAMTRSPYRANIIKGIKNKALQFQKSPSIKNSLKQFINKSIDYDERAEKNAIENDKRDPRGPRALKETQLVEGTVQDFWEGFIKIVNYVSPDSTTANAFLQSSALKQMMSRSSSAITANMSSQLKTNLANLVTAIDSADDSAQLAADGVSESYFARMLVVESTTPDELTTILTGMLTMADSDPQGLTAKKVLGSPAYNQFFNKVKGNLSQKFNGILRQKLNVFVTSLPKTTVQQPQTDTSSTSTTGTTGTTGTSGTGTAGSTNESLREDQTSTDWSFDSEDDELSIKSQALSMKLNAEESEKLIKSITNKDAVVVRDAEFAKKYVFSPRGVNVMVKQVGTQESYMMTAKDVDSLLDSFSAKPDTKRSDDEPEEEEQ